MTSTRPVRRRGDYQTDDPTTAALEFGARLSQRCQGPRQPDRRNRARAMPHPVRERPGGWRRIPHAARGTGAIRQGRDRRLAESLARRTVATVGATGRRNSCSSSASRWCADMDGVCKHLHDQLQLTYLFWRCSRRLRLTFGGEPDAQSLIAGRAIRLTSPANVERRHLCRRPGAQRSASRIARYPDLCRVGAR